MQNWIRQLGEWIPRLILVSLCGCTSARERGTVAPDAPREEYIRPAAQPSPSVRLGSPAGLGPQQTDASTTNAQPPRLLVNSPVALERTPITLQEFEPVSLANDPRVQSQTLALERTASHAAAVGLEYGPYLRGNYSYVPDAEDDLDSSFHGSRQRAHFRVGVPVVERTQRLGYLEEERRAACDVELARLRKARADSLANIRQTYLDALRDQAWIDSYKSLEQRAAQLLPRIEEAARRKEVLANEVLELHQAIESSQRQVVLRQQLLEQRLAILAARAGRTVQPVEDFVPVHHRCRFDPTKFGAAVATHPDVVAIDAQGRAQQSQIRARSFDGTTGRVEVGYAVEDNGTAGMSSGASAAVRVEVPLRHREIRNQHESEAGMLDAETRARAQAMQERLASVAFEMFSEFLNLRCKHADLLIQLDRENSELEMIATRRRVGQQAADVSELAEWRAADRAARTAAALKDTALQAESAFYEFLHAMSCELLTSELPLSAAELTLASGIRPMSRVDTVCRGVAIGTGQWPTNGREREFLTRFCQQRNIRWIVSDTPDGQGGSLPANLVAASSDRVWVWTRATSVDRAAELVNQLAERPSAGIIVPVGVFTPDLRNRLGTQLPLAVELELQPPPARGPEPQASTLQMSADTRPPSGPRPVDATGIMRQVTEIVWAAAASLSRGEGSLPACWLISGDLDVLERLDWSTLPANMPLRVLVRLPADLNLRESELEATLRRIAERAVGHDIEFGLADYATYRNLATR